MQPTHTTGPRVTLLATMFVSTACLAVGCDLDQPEVDEVVFESPSDYATPSEEAERNPELSYYEEDGMIVAKGEDFRVRIHRSRRVAELNVNRDQLADWFGKPFFRWSHEATRRLYEVFADDFDFIVFVPASAGQHPAIAEDGVSIRISNDVSGLGLVLHDHSDFFGSDGRLQSTILLGGIDHIINGPSLRELGERWGNHFLPTSHINHFGFSDVGGQLGGCAPDEIEQLGEDLYRCDFDGTSNWSPDGASQNDRPYGRLELYLMGLVPAEAVPPIAFAEDGAWVDIDQGIFSGTLRHTEIGKLIDQHGKRWPTHEESQREFRTLFVMVSAGEFAELSLFHRVDTAVAEFAAPEPVIGQPGVFSFHEATSGLATLDAWNLDASLE